MNHEIDRPGQHTPSSSPTALAELSPNAPEEATDFSLVEDCVHVDDLIARLTESGGSLMLTPSGIEAILRSAARLGASSERARLLSSLRLESERMADSHGGGEQGRLLGEVLVTLERDLATSSAAAAVEPEREATSDANMADLLQKLAKLAHTINNPLTSMIGRAQMLRLGGSPTPQIEKASRVIEESARRVAGHVQELSGLVKAGMDELGVAREVGLQRGSGDKRDE